MLKMMHEPMAMKHEMKKAASPMPMMRMTTSPMPMIKTMTMDAPVKKAVEVAKEEEKPEVRMMGGGPGKMGSPTAELKKAVDEKPLLSKTDQRCYQSRFTDLKGADPLEHYATVGQGQGRLGTCAR